MAWGSNFERTPNDVIRPIEGIHSFPSISNPCFFLQGVKLQGKGVGFVCAGYAQGIAARLMNCWRLIYAVFFATVAEKKLKCFNNALRI
jgi:hypothetical protein